MIPAFENSLPLEDAGVAAREVIAAISEGQGCEGQSDEELIFH